MTETENHYDGDSSETSDGGGAPPDVIATIMRLKRTVNAVTEALRLAQTGLAAAQAALAANTDPSATAALQAMVDGAQSQVDTLALALQLGQDSLDYAMSKADIAYGSTDWAALFAAAGI